MLVEGRECGDCSACCVFLPVNSPELTKPAGVRCPHCEGGGCAIHPRRPPICRGWFCGWRFLDYLDDAWRPDRSGIMLRPWKNDTYGECVIVMVIGALDDLLTEPVAEYLAGCVVRRQPVYLEVPGAVHFLAEHELINNHLAAPVAEGDLEGVRQALIESYMRLLLRAKQRDPLTLRVPA